MWNCYLLGVVTGLRKRAQELPDLEDVAELLEKVEDVQEAEALEQGAGISEITRKRAPRRPKHPEKFWKVPRSLAVRKRKRYIRQKVMPKSLLSA
jgi:hypothetical protein